jgi:hypothetical protein
MRSPARSSVDYCAWYKPVVHYVIGVDYVALRAVQVYGRAEEKRSHDDGTRFSMCMFVIINLIMSALH